MSTPSDDEVQDNHSKLNENEDHTSEFVPLSSDENGREAAPPLEAEGQLNTTALDATIKYYTNHSIDKAPNSTPRTIGSYRLVHIIGEGGMGAVWVAQQTEPVNRLVALKLIKTGRDSKPIVARFEAERQALALMDHPGIAKILDGGTTDEGQPYFVMEFVKGVYITEYCDSHRLGLPQRLDLFQQVCNAVQHAHQKGVVHRDLKPSNILVAIVDGKPVPKIIDFGLAKALDNQAKLTDKTLFTEIGAVVGTLQYMSPEQASLDAINIDTRTDIYSLGVLLYELLTGSTPIDIATLKQVALLKVLESIRESDPPRPSERLSSATNQIASISQLRQIDPTRLRKELRGDLDWIVMKAIEKDVGRRYASASGFAADVIRYLNDQPVLARPPSTGYKIRKFYRKNRGVVIGGSSMVLLLIAGLIGTLFGLRESQYQADKVRSINVKLTEAKSKAESEVASQKSILQFLENRILKAAEPMPEGLGVGVTLIEAVTKALPAINDDMQISNKAKADIHSLLSDVLFDSGNYDEALNEAVASKRILLTEEALDWAKIAKADVQIGRSLDSLDVRQKQMVLMMERALSNAKVRGLSPKDVIPLMKILGVVYSRKDVGRFEDSIIVLKEGVILAESMGTDDEKARLVISAKQALSVGLASAGRHDEANKVLEELTDLISAEYGASSAAMATQYLNLATAVTNNKDRFEEDESLYLEKALAIHKSVFGERSRITEETIQRLCNCYLRLKRGEEAINLQKNHFDHLRTQYGLSDGRTSDAFKAYVRTLVQAGETELANSLLEEIDADWEEPKNFDPRSVQIMTMYTESYFTVGKAEKGLEIRMRYLENCIRLYGESSIISTELQIYCAHYLCRMEQYKKGLELFDQAAVNISPEFVAHIDQISVKDNFDKTNNIGRSNQFASTMLIMVAMRSAYYREVSINIDERLRSCELADRLSAPPTQLVSPFLNIQFRIGLAAALKMEGRQTESLNQIQIVVEKFENEIRSSPKLRRLMDVSHHIDSLASSMLVDGGEISKLRVAIDEKVNEILGLN